MHPSTVLIPVQETFGIGWSKHFWLLERGKVRERRLQVSSNLLLQMAAEARVDATHDVQNSSKKQTEI